MESDGKKNREDQSSGTLDESSASPGHVSTHEKEVVVATPTVGGGNSKNGVDSLTQLVLRFGEGLRDHVGEV